MKNRPELVRQPARPLSASFRIAAITTASLGAAALLTGGLLIGIAFATKGEADKNGKEFQALLQQNPSSVNRENTLMVRDGIQAANTQMAAGIVVGSVGFAAGVAGVVMYATYIKSKAKANPAPPVSNSKKSRSVHCNLFP